MLEENNILVTENLNIHERFKEEVTNSGDKSVLMDKTQIGDEMSSEIDYAFEKKDLKDKT